MHFGITRVRHFLINYCLVKEKYFKPNKRFLLKVLYGKIIRQRSWKMVAKSQKNEVIPMFELAYPKKRRQHVSV